MLHCERQAADGELPLVFLGQKESPMSIATYDTASAVSTEVPAGAAPARKRPTLWSRIFAGLIEARRRQAFAELKRHGIMLPSELEQAGWKIDERSEASLPFARR
jgi:hypothetical protein